MLRGAYEQETLPPAPADLPSWTATAGAGAAGTRPAVAHRQRLQGGPTRALLTGTISRRLARPGAQQAWACGCSKSGAVTCAPGAANCAPMDLPLCDYAQTGLRRHLVGAGLVFELPSSRTPDGRLGRRWWPPDWPARTTPTTAGASARGHLRRPLRDFGDDDRRLRSLPVRRAPLGTDRPPWGAGLREAWIPPGFPPRRSAAWSTALRRRLRQREGSAAPFDLTRSSVDDSGLRRPARVLGERPATARWGQEPYRWLGR